MQLTPLLTSLMSDLDNEPVTISSPVLGSPLSFELSFSPKLKVESGMGWPQLPVSAAAMASADDLFGDGDVDGGDVVVAAEVLDIQKPELPRARMLSGLEAFEAMLDNFVSTPAAPAPAVIAAECVASPPPPPLSAVPGPGVRGATAAAGGAAHPVVDRDADPKTELARLFPKRILRSEKEVYRAYRSRVRGMTTEMASELAKARRRERQCVYAEGQRQRRLATIRTMQADVDTLTDVNTRLLAENAELKSRLAALGGAASQLGR